MKYKIISLDSRNAEEIHRIETESFSVPWSRESIESSLLSPVVVYFGARDFVNNLCAFVCTSVIPPEAEILNIAVSKSFRRQGIAESLLLHLMDYLKTTSVDTVFLEVRESNLPAQLLYQKRGFEVIGKRYKYYTDPIEDAILMKKIMA